MSKTRIQDNKNLLISAFSELQHLRAIRLHGVEVKLETGVKYLGITLDQNSRYCLE